MAHREPPPIDTIRLSTRDKRALIDELNQDVAKFPAAMNRRGVRLGFNIGNIVVAITHPNGSTVRYCVVPRNISTHGLAFLHGRFVYPGSPIQMLLPTRMHEWIRTAGSILNCRHISGLMHEISVLFDQPVDISQLVDLDSEQAEKTRREYEASRSQQVGTGASHIVGRALVVEDFESDRKLLCHWLTKCGLSVQDAPDETGALTALRDQGFDIAMIDMHLGDQDGLDLVRRMRDAGFAAPIVACSADDRDQVRAAALAAGCNAFLPKPCTLQSLRDVVEQLIALDLSAPAPADVIHSTMASDIQMRPLIQAFLEDLRLSIQKIQESAQAQDFQAVAHLCHQLKGAGGGYGFELLTQAARTVLGTLDQPVLDHAQVTRAIDSLTQLAQRLRL